MIQKLKEILRSEKMSGKSFAEYLGLQYTSYRGATKISAPTTPKWVKGFLLGYSLGRNGTICTCLFETLVSGQKVKVLLCDNCKMKENLDQ